MEAYRISVRLNLNYDNEDERLNAHLHLTRLSSLFKERGYIPRYLQDSRFRT